MQSREAPCENSCDSWEALGMETFMCAEVLGKEVNYNR